MKETLVDESGNVISTAVACTLVPNFVLDEMKDVEFIFLVDRSGSMSGKIQYVQDAMNLFMKSLPAECHFNIVGFGSSFYSLFPITPESSSQPYHDQTLSEACKHIATLKADKGGTEIFTPLSHIFNSQTSMSRQIFVLTDGQVNNTDAVVQLVSQAHQGQRNNSRLFSIGVGPSASRALVNGIARAGRGLSEFVQDNERLERKITALLKASLQPALTNATVELLEDDVVISAKEIEQAPFLLPPILSGTKLTFYSLLSTDKDQKHKNVNKIRVSAQSPDGPLSLQLPIETKNSLFNDKDKVGKAFVHTLAARAIVRDLEEGTSKLHCRDNRLCDVNAAAIKSEVCKWAKQFQLVTKHTSFVTEEIVSNPPEPEPVKATPRPSSLLRLFGSKAPVSSNSTQQNLQRACDQLSAREQYLQRKIEAELQKARQTKDKRQALMALKRKETYVRQLGQISNSLMSMEQQRMSLEAASLNHSVLNSMMSPSRCMQSSMRSEMIDDTMDDICEQMDIASEMSMALSAPLGSDLIEDEELERRLMALKCDDPVPLSSSNRSSTVAASVSSSASSVSAAQRELDEERELAELEAAMSLDSTTPAPRLSQAFCCETFSPSPLPSSVPLSLKTTTSDDRSKMSAFLSSQSSLGSFALSPALKCLLGLDNNRNEQMEALLKGDFASLWSTAIVVAYFELHLLSLKEEWELVIKKARKWLETQIAATSHSTLHLSLDEMLSQARSICS
eukprot:TRINITY_DN5718_c0_g4_i1.p1 TRINITY_DN5718_c0_g4~~TRINITY_DN5718_c0_g4_i1.p1  ORF type:complete len:736 (+),score=184.91 TRINITY_DN5718_c0_g4_i1:1050-3257(+)